ncbi:DNA polymerase III subunit beta [Spirochaetia bacterium]|nr:DNA polymerase III subunit beta [Spirochaetia bacterium]
MKFTCDRTILLKEVSIAQEIISSKNAISILSNIYLEAKNDELIIKATDIKVNFETKLPIEVKDEGSTTVFGEKFLGILNSIPEGELEFEQKDNVIVIKPLAKKIKFQLRCIASEKYPEFSAFNKDLYFEIPVRDFKDMIVQTVFAVSDDETRYFMNGVFLKKEENLVVMVATDGRRLSYVEKNVGGTIKDFDGIIIPPKVLSILMKRSGDEGLLGISLTDKNIFIQFGSYKLSSVLIEGQFPNYQRVIPEEQKFYFTVNRLETLEALKRVSLLVEQKSRRVYLSLAPGVMTVSSSREGDDEEGDIGSAKEDIPCKYDGEEVSIALNYRYIEEPFKVMTSDEISVHFTEVTKAITIKPVPEKDFFHIAMPMQLD